MGHARLVLPLVLHALETNMTVVYTNFPKMGEYIIIGSKAKIKCVLQMAIGETPVGAKHKYVRGGARQAIQF